MQGALLPRIGLSHVIGIGIHIGFLCGNEWELDTSVPIFELWCIPEGWLFKSITEANGILKMDGFVA